MTTWVTLDGYFVKRVRENAIGLVCLGENDDDEIIWVPRNSLQDSVDVDDCDIIIDKRMADRKGLIY